MSLYCVRLKSVISVDSVRLAGSVKRGLGRRKHCWEVAILMLSRGVPMIVAGDEVRRTQKGNNNAYCQDNEISWFDWRLTEKNSSLLRSWKLLIAARQNFRAGRPGRYFEGEVNERGLRDVVWHGTQLRTKARPDPWSPTSKEPKYPVSFGKCVAANDKFLGLGDLEFGAGA